jgi:hypothetical protein
LKPIYNKIRIKTIFPIVSQANATQYFKIINKNKDKSKTIAIPIINIMKLTDPRWSQAVISGAPLPARTAHASTILSHSLFVYGGTDSTHGIYNDLWKLPLNNSSFTWQQISKGPSPRKYHTFTTLG